MALIKRGKKRDTDEQLRERGRASLAEARRASERIRSGKADASDYLAQRAALESATAARDELDRRQRERGAAVAEERDLREHGPRVSLSFARNGPLRAELEGVPRLDPSVFTREDREELWRLRRANGRGELTDDKGDMRSLERLIDRAAVAAGHGPGLIARRRRELKQAEKHKREAHRLHLEMLPRRREPEPGSVELPRAVWEALTDGRDDTYELADVAALAVFAFSFANGSSAAFARRNCRFDRDDAGPVLTFRDAAAGMHFAPGVNVSGVGVYRSLTVLAANKWIVTERESGTLRIRPGDRLRSLFPGGGL